MFVVELLIAALVLAGHIGLWAGLFNRAHATALPEWVITLLSLVCHTMLVSLGAALGLWWLERLNLQILPASVLLEPPASSLQPLAWAYSAFCLVIAVGPLSRWAFHRLFDRTPAVLLSNHTSVVDLAEIGGECPIRGPVTTLLSCVPGNDFLRLHVQEKELTVPRLPAALDGLTIAHVSDLHFCGRLTRPFFEEVISRVNAMDADFVALTGDFFDRRECLDWIGDTLGRLRARHGVYFVLGNHDRYIGDVAGTRLRLTATGLVDLGGRWLTIDVDGTPILLAGNELPWHGPAAAMENAGVGGQGSGVRAENRPLRILLSHTPDQLDWARRWDFDLMLAGHTHGGQVRLPLVGPLFVPSRIEVRYSAGVFHVPPVVMHVTRGVSGKTPLRINCPPEIAKLTLRKP
jgi:predicted MPP superfamily phosphohydrolase